MMKTAKRITMIIAMTTLLLWSSGWDTAQAQENKTLFEETSVTNIQLPVRVFLKKKPVADLEKKDFKIFVDGKEQPITGFYQVRKKLAPPPPKGTNETETHGLPSRLLVLIFNVSDYHVDLEKDIDIVFDNILRKGDRFMVISNSFFLPETTIKDPVFERQRVRDTLKKESKKLIMHTIQVESELRSIGNTFIRKIEDPFYQDQPEYPTGIFREYYRNYVFTLEQFKQGFFGMAKTHYVRLAEYLKSQDVEKWVLNFYQLGMFPQPKLQGRIQSTINAFTTGEGNIRVKSLVMDYEPRVVDVDKWMVDNISKLFINTGATVHTLLIHPRPKGMMDHYEYRPIPTESENILRKMSRLTGGVVGHRMDTENFVEKISATEDIYYMLAYAPPNKESPDSIIKIEINTGKKYRLVYDNKRKPRAFKSILAKIKRDNLPLKIQRIHHDNHLLTVVVENIKTVTTGEAQETKTGRLEARLKLMDGNAEVVWETVKTYRSKKSQSAFQVIIPPLREGRYDVIVEVRDLLSWKTDTTGENIKI